MLHFGDSVYEAELRRDVSVEVEEYRLARLASAEQVAERRSTWAEGSRRLMARLGDLLVDWGCELQSRYTAESSTTLS